MEPANPSLPADDVAAIDRLGTIYKELSAELSKVIIGQQRVVELLSIALFSRGHALLMGVPGLAKTLLISSVAKTLDLSFNRIQFTPDLMPADITGTDIIQDDSAGGKRQFEFIKGPVFANIVLADEINRAPAKTQSALLEAMQEYRVTVMGRTFTLLPPFFVLATQNPIEQEGTYPLPDADVGQVGGQPACAHVFGLHLFRVVVHGAGKVHDDVGAQVGVRLKLLDVIPVRAGVGLPVQAPGVVARHVLAVFRKLHGRAAVGAPVASGHVPRHALASLQREVAQAGKQVVVQVLRGHEQSGKGVNAFRRVRLPRPGGRQPCAA